MTTITSGVTTITPLMVTEYRARRKAGNLIHKIVASPWPAVTLRPARPRTGTLQMLCATQEDALALDAMHASAARLALADPDLPGINMTYVAAGEISVELEDTTRKLWLFSVEFQEIQP